MEFFNFNLVLFDMQPMSSENRSVNESQSQSDRRIYGLDDSKVWLADSEILQAPTPRHLGHNPSSLSLWTHSYDWIQIICGNGRLDGSVHLSQLRLKENPNHSFQKYFETSQNWFLNSSKMMCIPITYGIASFSPKLSYIPSTSTSQKNASCPLPFETIFASQSAHSHPFPFPAQCHRC
jgi:hypothetical protein